LEVNSLELESSHLALLRSGHIPTSTHLLRGWSVILQVDQPPLPFRQRCDSPNYSVVKEHVPTTLRKGLLHDPKNAAHKFRPFSRRRRGIRVSPAALRLANAHLEGDKRSAHARKTAQFIRDIVTTRINIGDLRHGFNDSGARCRDSKAYMLADGNPPRRFLSRLYQSSHS